MKVNVHVRDQMFSIFCGSGSQKVRWLSDVALHRYEHFFGVDPGLAKGMRYENGNLIDMENIISDKLENEIHVWVILKEDLALMESEQQQREQSKGNLILKLLNMQSSDDQALLDAENFYLLVSNHIAKSQIAEIHQLMNSSNMSIGNLVENFVSLPETPKAKLKIKQMIAKTILRLTDVEVFKKEIYNYLIRIIQVEQLVKNQNQELHNFSIQIMISLLSTKDSITFIASNYLEIFKSITALIHHEDSGISQKAIKLFLTILNNLNQVNPQIIDSTQDQISGLLIQGVKDEDTIILVRYFELSVNIALISDQLSKISEESLNIIFQRFFDLDSLTQMTIMDFISIIGSKPWTTTLITKSQFLHKMFNFYKENESHEAVTNNLIILASHIYSLNPDLFNALKEPGFLWFFNNLVNSKSTKDLETFCSCMSYFLRRKESIPDYFIHNLPVLQVFLQCARSTDSSLKKCFLVALKQCLKIKEEEREKYNEPVRRIFSNICSPQNFPNLGQDNQSVDFMITYTNVPFPECELMGLKVLKQLINWDWGMKALYGNSNSVAYILNRQPKDKELCEKRFRLVEKTLNSKFFVKSSGVIDPVIGEQLENYYASGVYGTTGGPNYIPEYTSKSS